MFNEYTLKGNITVYYDEKNMVIGRKPTISNLFASGGDNSLYLGMESSSAAQEAVVKTLQLRDINEFRGLRYQMQSDIGNICVLCNINADGQLQIKIENGGKLAELAQNYFAKHGTPLNNRNIVVMVDFGNKRIYISEPNALVCVAAKDENTSIIKTVEDQKRLIYDYIESFAARRANNTIWNEYNNIDVVLSKDIVKCKYSIDLSKLIELYDDLVDMIKRILIEMQNAPEEKYDWSISRIVDILESGRSFGGEIIERCRRTLERIKDPLSQVKDKRIKKKIEQEIDEILKRIELMNFIILGEFTAIPRPTIVLYIQSIENNANSKGVAVLDVLLSVFLHESFHAYHYFMCSQKQNKWREFCENDKVIESLAAYIEYNYCLDVINNPILARDEEKIWDKYSLEIWPYSGAKYLKNIYATKNLSEHKYRPFRFVFDESLTSFSSADKALEIYRYVSDDVFGMGAKLVD